MCGPSTGRGAGIAAARREGLRRIAYVDFDVHHGDGVEARFAADLARELSERHCAGRWVATGGGGYRPFTVWPRAFALVWAAVSGRALPQRLDAGWREHWSMLLAEPRDAARSVSPPWHGARPASAPGVGEELPREFIDPPFDDPRNAAAARDNARSLASLRALHVL